MHLVNNIIFEDSPEIKLIVECDNYKIISANKAARKYFRSLNPEKRENYLTDFLTEKKSRKLQKLSSKKSSAISSILLKNKKGKPVDFRIEVVRIKLKNKNVAECTLKKNTKTRRTPKTADDLKVIQAKLKSIFDNNPLMIFILDKNGIIKEVNSLGAKELGYELRELIDQPVTKVFYKEDWQTVKNQISECLNNPTKTFNWEIRKVRKSGDTIWVR